MAVDIPTFAGHPSAFSLPNMPGRISSSREATTHSPPHWSVALDKHSLTKDGLFSARMPLLPPAGHVVFCGEARCVPVTAGKCSARQTPRVPPDRPRSSKLVRAQVADRRIESIPRDDPDSRAEGR